MKKILIILFTIFCIFSFCDCVNAVSVTTQNVQQTRTNLKSLPFGKYLEFYSIDYKDVNMSFIELTGEKDRKFISTLNNEEKENYKYVKKVQKLISKGNWGEVLYKYPDYFPAYVQYYSYCMNQKNFREALRILLQIQNVDKYAQVFSEDLMNYSLGTLYYNTGNFSKALEYFRAYENTGRDYIYSSIANCYFYMGNYQTAINYKKKMKNLAYIDREMIYDSYLKLNDIESAHKIAKDLLKEKYGFTNLMRLESTSPNEETKLAYAYTARNTASTDSQIIEINNIIANLEQKKLDSKTSKVNKNQFIKVPKWYDIKKHLPPNVLPAEISKKQDEFFKTANEYLDKYTGQNLTNAFNSLNQDYTNYIQTKQNQYYKEKELEAQAEIMAQQQMMNQMRQQQLIRQQRMRYFLDMDRMYYLSNPNYYMYPGRYDMLW